MLELEQRALKLYNSGCNCAQAVFCALAERQGMDIDQAQMISSGFGTGMAKLGETCGAITGLYMGLGLEMGFKSNSTQEVKDAYFEKVQKIGISFRNSKGSLRGHEIKQINKDILRTEVDGVMQKECNHVVSEAIKLYYQFK